MMRVLCTCGFGFAIFGFLAFVLAQMAVFTVPAIAVALIVTIAAGHLCWRRPLLARSTWSGQLLDLRNCFDWAFLFVYYAMLAFAFPAVNQTNLGSDAVGYYLVYASEWAHAGGFVVDPFLREPFYASNFTLFFGTFMMFGGVMFVTFLTWSMGLVTALAVCASVRASLERSIGIRWGAVAGCALALAVIIAPSYFRWLDSAYADAPIGAMALLFVVAIILGERERRPEWFFVAAAIGGFLIGMKPSFIPFVLVFALALYVALARCGNGRRVQIAVVVVLLIFASPWYVRNLVLAGDPISPVLNLAIHGSDGLMTKDEAANLAADLATSRSPLAIATLPFRAYLDTTSRDFREYGSTALMLLLYVPSLWLILRFLRVKTAGPISWILVLLLSTFILYWIYTSTLLRYATLFVPILAVCLCYPLREYVRGRFAGPVVALIAVLALIPSPGSADYYRQTYESQFRYLAESYTGDNDYLLRFGERYREATFAVAHLRAAKLRGRIYMLGPRVGYYIVSGGYEAIGDWVGPAGYFRLFRAIDANRSPEFLSDLGVAAVLVDPDQVLGGLAVPLERQLTAAGYCRIAIPESTVLLLVRERCRE